MKHTVSVAQPASILLVEDNEDIRWLLIDLLEDEGYRISFAESGQEGLEQAERNRPDLILMDLTLRGMSGWDVVAQLRQNPQFVDTPIVALTAHASVRDQERAMAVGCTDYISKPFDNDQLLERIAELLLAPLTTHEM